MERASEAMAISATGADEFQNIRLIRSIRVRKKTHVLTTDDTDDTDTFFI